MKRAMRLVMLCMAGLLLMAGVSQAEEGSWYDGHENWIVRVFSAPSGTDYAVTLEVIDTANTLITDPILGLSTNPYPITGTAGGPDVSLAFDEATATAYVIYTSAGGTGVSLQAVPDIVRAGGTLTVTPNPVVFGNVGSGNISKKTVTVSNTGNLPVQITDISKPGDPYSIAGTSTCAAGMTLAPGGGSCTIVVKFSPPSANTFNNSFVISSNGGNVTVLLQGVGQ